MQRRGFDGDRRLAVATPEGNGPRDKRKGDLLLFKTKNLHYPQVTRKYSSLMSNKKSELFLDQFPILDRAIELSV